jgi:ribosomal protein S18 acetylase RimI-like enzyme
MITIKTANSSYRIAPITDDDLEAILEVYRQCEDFLALGPVSTASKEMVITDIENADNDGALYCGIYTVDRKMVGVVEYIACGYLENPEYACLCLLMIAVPFRSMGIGQAVVRAVEKEICKHPEITKIYSGVQVNHPDGIRFWQRNGYKISGGPTLMPDHTTVFELQKDIK